MNHLLEDEHGNDGKYKANDGDSDTNVGNKGENLIDHRINWLTVLKPGTYVLLIKKQCHHV